MPAKTSSTSKHLAVMLIKDNSIYGRRILNLQGDDYRPLRKELAWAAVAARPEFAGMPWELDAELLDVETKSPRLLLSALGGPDPPELLASLKVSIGCFAWVGSAMAYKFGWEPNQFSVQVALLPPGHGWIEEANEWNDEDFHVDVESAPESTLPADFSTAPLGARRSIRRVGGNTRCVFSAAAWEQFLAAAENEVDVERAWVASTQVHLVDGVSFLLIEGEIRNLPAAEASRHHLVTHGRDFAAVHSELGDRLAAYLHLHPREAGDLALGPYPSPADVTVAWNLDACTSRPVVMPIALFGTRARTVNKESVEVAAHAYVGGLLTELNLEVMKR